MAFEARPLADLIAIAEAGGGIEIGVAPKKTEELVALAEAARRGGARLSLYGLAARTTAELVEIARAGGGNVTFADRPLKADDLKR